MITFSISIEPIDACSGGIASHLLSVLVDSYKLQHELFNFSIIHGAHDRKWPKYALIVILK